MKFKTIVVLGSGQAADMAALRAREVDHDARIIMIDNTSASEIGLDMEARAISVKDGEDERRTGFDALIFCAEVSHAKLEIEGLIESDLMCSQNLGQSVIIIGCSSDAIATAQRLKASGVSVTIVERSPQILPQFSFETSQRALRSLRNAGIEVRLSEKILKGQRLDNGYLRLTTSKDNKLEAESILSGIDSAPDVEILAQAGAMVSSDGALLVDASMSTSLSSVFACGDGVSVLKALSNNRQSRPSLSMVERGAQVAGANAARPASANPELMRPCAGSEIVQIGDLYFARTGLSNQEVHQMYPGDSCVRETVIAGETTIRLYAERESGAIVAGELVGNFETICRLDVISQCILNRLNAGAIIDLDVPSIFREAAEHLQAAVKKESESIAGEKIVLWLAEQRKFEWLEVGENASQVSKYFEHAKHVPLKDLKKKLPDFSTDVPLVLTSASGKSAKLAYRMLKKKGFTKVFHLEGGSHSLELLMGG